jgi:hypothetical protein
MCYRPRSTRKRKTNVDDSDDLRHWTKDKYVKLLSETGIAADPTWKVDIVHQLFLANTNTAVKWAIPNNGDPINVDTNQATDSAAVAADVQPSNSRPPVNTATRTEEILKETTLALKTATEALTTMTSFVGSVMQQRNNVTQSSNRRLDKTGVIYAEDLSKMDYVSPIIRKQILEWKDVNLACLLTPKYEVPNVRSLQSEGLVVELSSPHDVRLDHHLTLDEFNKAFRKYRNVLCKPYPQSKDEMEQHEADINEIAHNYGPTFYIYHKSFSAKAANAIVEHNVVINGAKEDDRMLHLIMHGTPSRHCEHRGEFDHISRFCESQKYKTPANLQKVNTHNDRSVDKLGRDIKRLDGREICNNFNFGVCSQKTCKFVHACVSCKGRDHNIKTCKNNKGDQHNPKDKKETIPRHK